MHVPTRKQKPIFRSVFFFFFDEETPAMRLRRTLLTRQDTMYDKSVNKQNLSYQNVRSVWWNSKSFNNFSLESLFTSKLKSILDVLLTMQVMALIVFANFLLKQQFQQFRPTPSGIFVAWTKTNRTEWLGNVQSSLWPTEYTRLKLFSQCFHSENGHGRFVLAISRAQFSFSSSLVL